LRGSKKPAAGGGQSAAGRRKRTVGGSKALIAAARKVRRHARADFSGFKVGAALETADGTIVTGCNVENASYPAALCAERAAVGAAVSRGLTRFRAVAVVTAADVPTPPCGMCRQVLVEFAPALRVVSEARDGRRAEWSLAALLPAPFDPAALLGR